MTTLTAHTAVSRAFWLHVQSPVHIGVGRGVGFVDLPIIRETITNWPYVPGSSLKGVLAARYEATDENRRADTDMGRRLGAAFGRPDDDGEYSDNAGSLVFSDARLVCLPVRSLFGTFAECTSSLALRRLKRDLDLLSLTAAVPDVPPDQHSDNRPPVRLTKSSALNNGGVFFEDLDFEPKLNDEHAEAWSGFLAGQVFQRDEEWQSEFRKRFAIVSNEIFDFLCESATEVVARVRLDHDRKTVKAGPWYEEALPAESILAGFVWGDRVFGARRAGRESGAAPELSVGDLLDDFCSTGEAVALQLGGKATVGRGRVRCQFSE